MIHPLANYERSQLVSNTPASLRSDRPAELPGLGGRFPSECLAELTGILSGPLYR